MRSCSQIIVIEKKIFQVSVVAHGTTNIMADEDGRDPYEEPRKQKKFVQVRYRIYLSFITVMRNDKIKKKRSQFFF